MYISRIATVIHINKRMVKDYLEQRILESYLNNKNYLSQYTELKVCGMALIARQLQILHV